MTEIQSGQARWASRAALRLGPWCLVALAALLRLGAFAAADGPAELSYLPDSAEYDRLGWNLAAQGTYSLSEAPPWTPDATRTPVYSAFVALCYKLAGHAPAAVVVVQLVLAALTCGIVYALGDRLAGPVAGTSGAALLAVDPLSVGFSALLLSETLFTLLFTGSLFCLVAYLRRPRPGLALAAALLTGLAVLCRPIAVLWPLGPLAVFGLAAWRDRRWRPLGHGLLFLALIVAVVAPWLARNRHLTGRPVLSTVQGINLYYHRAARVVADREGIPLGEAQARLRERIEGTAEREGLNPYEANALVETWGREIIWAAPGTYVRLHAWGVVHLLLPHDRPLPGLPGPAGCWLEGGLFALTCVLAAGGLLWGVLRSGRLPFVLLAAVLLYFAAMSGPEAYARFRVPVMPALVVLAGAGLAWALRGNLRRGEAGG